MLWRGPDQTLIEGTVDFVFDDGGELILLDFKTDRELTEGLDRYRRQIAIYCSALQSVRGARPRGILVNL